MTYIPEQHRKYNLLPYCQEDGGEVFEYPGELVYRVENMINNAESLMPYNYESYEGYYLFIDSLVDKYGENTEVSAALIELKEAIKELNTKEEWSVLRYIGPSDDRIGGLTNNKIYYWPTTKDNPIYRGVVDNEEFTAYMYPTEENLWEILEDPTGMAYRTIYEKADGYMSQESYDSWIKQMCDILVNE